MKDDTLYCLHIQECIDRIFSYTGEMTQSQFMNSPLVQDAVLRNLQVLAESTQRLSEAFKNRHPEIQWHRISGLRNILVHDYLGIDMYTVWGILDHELIALRKTVS